MEALDDYIPIPERAIEGDFLMPVEDVFSISGRGTVVTGRIERGVVKVGDEVEIVGIRETSKSTCTGVEMFRKLLDEGQAGDNVGVLLRGVKRDEVERGQVLSRPRSITPHTDFEAEVYILTKEEGGSAHAVLQGVSAEQFYFRTTDVTGAVQLPETTEMVMPGDNVQMRVQLIDPIAMEEGVAFCDPRGGVARWVRAWSRRSTSRHRRNSKPIVDVARGGMSGRRPKGRYGASLERGQ